MGSETERDGTERNILFLLAADGIASNRYFPRLDRKIKSVTEETLLSRETPLFLDRFLCGPSSVPQFVLQEPFFLIL